MAPHRLRILVTYQFSRLTMFVYFRAAEVDSAVVHRMRKPRFINAYMVRFRLLSDLKKVFSYDLYYKTTISYFSKQLHVIALIISSVCSV